MHKLQILLTAITVSQSSLSVDYLLVTRLRSRLLPEHVVIFLRKNFHQLETYTTETMTTWEWDEQYLSCANVTSLTTVILTSAKFVV